MSLFPRLKLPSIFAGFPDLFSTPPHDELAFSSDLRRGDTDMAVKRVQEWLTLSGHGLVIDGAFGPATESAVRAFQQNSNIAVTGIVDRQTFEALTAPLCRAITPTGLGFGASLGELVVAYARQHLVEHPREVGGQNAGPWVRLYMEGHEGPAWPWCAGFVSFVLRQTADTLNTSAPVVHTFSCDVLALDARSKGRLISAEDAAASLKSGDAAVLGPGSLFLNRRSPTDWDHTGIVISFEADFFRSIEGNTNDAGDREGYEVCERMRSYGGKDFVKI